MIRFVCRAFLVALVTCTTVSEQAQAALPIIYGNLEFGIYSVIDRKVCLPTPPEHDHGFVIPLDNHNMGCDGVLDHSYLGVVGDYNAHFEPDSHSLLEWLCDSDQGRLSRAPIKLAIPRHVSVSGLCTLGRVDGIADMHF